MMTTQDLIQYLEQLIDFSPDNSWGTPAKICFIIGVTIQLIIAFNCARKEIKAVPLIVSVVACLLLGILALNANGNVSFELGLSSIILLFFIGYIALGVIFAWAVYGIVLLIRKAMKTSKHTSRRRKK